MWASFPGSGPLLPSALKVPRACGYFKVSRGALGAERYFSVLVPLFKTQCRCGVLASSVPSPIGSRGHAGSAAAQVPAVLRCGGAGSSPTCASPGMDPVLWNTEPNFTLPLCGIPGPQPRGCESASVPDGRVSHQGPGSVICFLPLRFKGMMLALGVTGPAPV